MSEDQIKIFLTKGHMTEASEHILYYMLLFYENILVLRKYKPLWRFKDLEKICYINSKQFRSKKTHTHLNVKTLEVRTIVKHILQLSIDAFQYIITGNNKTLGLFRNVTLIFYSNVEQHLFATVWFLFLVSNRKKFLISVTIYIYGFIYI